MRISDWSSDVCSSDLLPHQPADEILIEGRQESRALLEDDDLGAGAPHDVRELEGDVAAADQHDSPWPRLQVEKIVAGRQMLLAGNAETHLFGAGGAPDMAAFEPNRAAGPPVPNRQAGPA